MARGEAQRTFGLEIQLHLATLCEAREAETTKSSTLRSSESHRTALIRSLAASTQNLIVPPKDKARFRASNEAESSCGALIPLLRAPKCSYVTTSYGCRSRSARRTLFLFLLTLNGAPPTSTSAHFSEYVLIWEHSNLLVGHKFLIQYLGRVRGGAEKRIVILSLDSES